MRSFRWLAVAITGYVALRIVQYAYPNDPPPGGEVALGVSGLVMLVGAIGFLIIRTRMYWSGDDL